MSYKFPERSVEVRSYELALILSPENSDANKNLIKDLEKIIKENKDKITTKDPWGIRRMAYTIDKFRDGDYTFFVIDIKQKTKREIETFLKDSEGILRYRFFKNTNYKSPVAEEKPKEEAKAEKPKEEAKAEKPKEEAKAEKPKEEAK
ncbi:30S ribosomal protein S6, partial [bacterium]|nr:30S ribosomal protein S6 [bacterium]